MSTSHQLTKGVSSASMASKEQGEPCIPHIGRNKGCYSRSPRSPGLTLLGPIADPSGALPKVLLRLRRHLGHCCDSPGALPSLQRTGHDTGKQKVHDRHHRTYLLLLGTVVTRASLISLHYNFPDGRNFVSLALR